MCFWQDLYLFLMNPYYFKSMKTTNRFFLSILFLLVFQFSFSQEKKPKVALVLSGGGAKGIAHISTLQMLDSLGIVPDLVIGTSMGSVVGGLYAMGYSGDQIEKLTKDTNWETLFSGGVSLRDISNEEKSEYGKYLVDFDFVKGKPKVSSAIISDQNLRAYLHSLTYPVYNISDFDDLPIPYRAVATDIVNGKEVVLDKGSMNFAMRASMSIPGVFLPLEYDNTLLVDGGVLNNFPTDVAKRLGADIIIGSDVGGGMQPKEKLDNIVSLLFQTGMLSSNLKNPGNRAICDIVVDHVANLTYGTGDFENATEIYEEGKIATRQNTEKFVELAQKLEKFPQRKHVLPEMADDFLIDSIDYRGISKRNMKLVESRSKFKSKTNYTTEQINQGIDKIIGTNIFDRINYNITKEDGENLALQINAVENSVHQVKGSLHFDNDRGFGLIFNYTGRNVIGNSSRILFTADLATEQRFRGQYQKIFGSSKDWWFRSEVLTENLNQEFRIGGEIAEDLKYRYFQYDNQINKNLSALKSYVGIGINYEFTRLKPRIDPSIQENALGLERYSFKNLEIYTQYAWNTMDEVLYPKKGTSLRAVLKRSLNNEAEIEYYFPEETIDDYIGSTNGFTKLSIDFEKRFDFTTKITGILGVATGLTFYDELKSDEISYSDFGYGSKYYLGGTIERPRKDNYIFYGLYEGEQPVTQFMMLELAMQYNISGKIFLKPHINIASIGFEDFDEFKDHAFSPKGDWKDNIETSGLISAGVTASINTFLGPVDFDLSWVNDIDKVRLFFGVGLQFNRSN